LSEFLEVKRDGPVLHVTLNRPEKRNALSVALCDQIVNAFEDGDHDPGIHAILLTANGKAFCAGMDLNEALAGNSAAITSAHERLFTIGSRLAKPIVCAVQGAALAGGVGLVANCHIVLAAEDAVFALTEIRLGLWPFLVFRALTAAIGERRSLALALTGENFGAAAALQTGLVYQVVPAAELLERANAMAITLSKWSPSAVRSGLDYVRETRGQDWWVAGEIARQIREQLFRTRDFQEAIQAFREKRLPEWRGE
jgi:enoyl-CoA hydratase/carnithine racemase